MAIQLRQIPRLLKVIIEFEVDDKLRPLETEIKKVFNDLPILEATYPNFSEIKKFCLDCRILIKEDSLLKVSPFGREIIDNGNSDLEFNKKQLDLITQNCFLEGFYSELILEKLSFFNIDDTGKFWYPSGKLLFHFNHAEILPLLYECNLFELQGDKVYLNVVYSELLKPQIANVVPKKSKISQNQIDEQLKNFKIIGEIGEEIVLLYEKIRLKELGAVDESKKVESLAKNFANAGYDIRSFNSKTDNLEHNRFIEVKSSVNKKLDFHWSENEVNIAKELGSNYWLYFVPEINSETRKTKAKIERIQNPYKRIFENSSYTKTIESYHVQFESDDYG